MGVDRKADHVGTHGGAYTDNDGNRKQFTYVDHDRHTSRLKIFDYTKKEVPKTHLQELADKICEEGLNANPDFINEFDTTLSQTFEFERFRKGKVVDYSNFDNSVRGSEWYLALNELYERYTKNKLGISIQKGSTKEDSRH